LNKFLCRDPELFERVFPTIEEHGIEIFVARQLTGQWACSIPIDSDIFKKCRMSGNAKEMLADIGK
jgi:hypothetical protein